MPSPELNSAGQTYAQLEARKDVTSSTDARNPGANGATLGHPSSLASSLDNDRRHEVALTSEILDLNSYPSKRVMEIDIGLGGRVTQWENTLVTHVRQTQQLIKEAETRVMEAKRATLDAETRCATAERALDTAMSLHATKLGQIEKEREDSERTLREKLRELTEQKEELQRTVDAIAHLVKASGCPAS